MSRLSFLSAAFLIHLLLLLLLHVPSSCSQTASNNFTANKAHDNSDCTRSCGNINISYPFRLKGDSKHCGSESYELSCEANGNALTHHAVLYLFSVKYYVLEIDYNSLTIRLVDAGVHKISDNYFSHPHYSLTRFNISRSSFQYILVYSIPSSLSVPIIFLSCENPMNSSAFIVETAPCINGISSNSSSNSSLSSLRTYSYVMVGEPPLYTIYRFFHIDELILCRASGMCSRLPSTILLIYKWRRRHLSMYEDIEDFLRSNNNLTPIRYSYSDIKKMARGFMDKLGEGGYGSVYKAKLRSGRLVAIKMLGKSKTNNGQDFINEVATIGRIRHVNVVRLIGFCVEGSKRALVYDFMSNGSLEKYIFSQQGDVSLSCHKIFEIALGVARGIDYLHQGCDMQILHFDIKPHNILLDENFTPKVSDFGLAKLYPLDNSIVSLTAARGTMGYIAPELFYKNIGGVSYKADVYSFGMLLMEMAGRRKNLNAGIEQSSQFSQIYFPTWVSDQLKAGKDIEIGDDATDEEKKIIKKMMMVALWCIQMKPIERPSMNKVVEMLEGEIESLQMPPRPFLYPQQIPADEVGVDNRSPCASSASESEEITLIADANEVN
ncbi:PREDICTED: rust resistance kinase Lr10 [Prunus dulcis]|uniref:PREDICTED: rust resistance kinase Lr10 n=2 Tax=Prunus dulcis TaxID=3755 RepID=A0A5E4GGU8_PRUDU|nr:PREDICTED: rust resistance kinase Lr10 [Prunus dulcis]